MTNDIDIPQKALWGSPDKLLRIGDVDVECYVLEDGKRVLSGRGMQSAIGFGGTAITHGSKLREFLEQKDIRPFVPKELAMAMKEPVKFIRPGRGGRAAIAFEATLLIDLCDTIIEASNAEVLPKSYNFLVRQAQVITSSFAKAGIIAAVDEVTGYQEVRERDAIQKILDKYLHDFARTWSKTFPDDFWKKLLKIKGVASVNFMKRPAFVGHWVNDIVYDRLAPGIRKRLKELNPKTQAGYKKHRDHSFLTEDHGVPELKSHLMKVMTLIDAAANKTEFERLLNRSLPKYGETIEMTLEEV